MSQLMKGRAVVFEYLVPIIHTLRGYGQMIQIVKMIKASLKTVPGQIFFLTNNAGGNQRL